MEVVTAHPIVDAVLDRHRDALGDDLPTYRNLVYRCINYHKLLLGAPVPDFAALAWAAHDLGIWTARTFDYLTPSADLAARHAAEFGIADIDRLQTLITEHHRLRRLDDRVTETFRWTCTAIPAACATPAATATEAAPASTSLGAHERMTSIYPRGASLTRAPRTR